MTNANDANTGSGDDEQKKTAKPEQAPDTAQPAKEPPAAEPASEQRPPSDS